MEDQTVPETDNNYAIYSEGGMIYLGGNVGIGIEAPSEKLEIEGYVKAHGFNTGDIIFNKDDKPVWRMFEDEKGLYVQSCVTNKKYSVVLKELDSSENDVSQFASYKMEDEIKKIQAENNLLKERLSKIEKIILNNVPDIKTD